jgi:hypothetical protein
LADSDATDMELHISSDAHHQTKKFRQRGREVIAIRRRKKQGRSAPVPADSDSVPEARTTPLRRGCFLKRWRRLPLGTLKTLSLTTAAAADCNGSSGNSEEEEEEEEEGNASMVVPSNGTVTALTAISKQKSKIAKKEKTPSKP